MDGIFSIFIDIIIFFFFLIINFKYNTVFHLQQCASPLDALVPHGLAFSLQKAIVSMAGVTC